MGILACRQGTEKAHNWYTKFLQSMKILVLTLLFGVLATPTVFAKSRTLKSGHTGKSASPGKKPSKREQANSSTRNRRVEPARPSGPTQDRYREIQQALADKGYFTGTVDGSWGPEATDALKRFQTEQSISGGGKINSLSLIALGLGPKREESTQLIANPELPGQRP